MYPALQIVIGALSQGQPRDHLYVNRLPDSQYQDLDVAAGVVARAAARQVARVLGAEIEEQINRESEIPSGSELRQRMSMNRDPRITLKMVQTMYQGMMLKNAETRADIESYLRCYASESDPQVVDLPQIDLRGTEESNFSANHFILSKEQSSLVSMPVTWAHQMNGLPLELDDLGRTELLICAGLTEPLDPAIIAQAGALASACAIANMLPLENGVTELDSPAESMALIEVLPMSDVDPETEHLIKTEAAALFAQSPVFDAEVRTYWTLACDRLGIDPVSVGLEGHAGRIPEFPAFTAPDLS